MTEEIRELTDKEILLELKEWYKSKELARMLDITEATISNFLNDKSSFAKTNSEKLRRFFDKHVQENSKFEHIKDVFSKWDESEKDFMVDTPDGFQYVSKFIKKSSRPCYDLRAVNFHIECSGDHLCETESGWVKTEDIKPGDRILTRVGYETVQQNEQIDDSEVYDMSVEHENHRYWGGAGISSHNSGKSFLVSAAIAQAQADGYMVVILDSEQAMSQDYLSKIGVDTSSDKLMTVQTYTVEDTQDIIVDVLNDVKAAQQELNSKDELKLMLVVDSLGLLSSGKAAKDAEAGNQAADMGTKAKALVRMFNAITQKIGVTETVCIMTNHGALEVGVMYPELKPTGGRCLVAGTLVQTDEGMKAIETVEVGDLVRTHMDRFKPVEKLFQFDDLDVLEVELENGQVIKMTPEHKMLVERNSKKQWVEAKDLTVEDSFLRLNETVSANLESTIKEEVEI